MHKKQNAAAYTTTTTKSMMKKLICTTFAIATMSFALTACAQPNSHRHLHGKTQVEDAQGQHGQYASHSTYTYADNIIEAQVDENCNVKKVNGFAPKHVKHVKKDMTQVATQMGATLSVLKLADSQCDITWTDADGKSGILKVK